MPLSFYKNKRVFISGITGFKGSWLALWLESLGAQVCGLALKPATNPALFDVLKLSERTSTVIANINDAAALEKAFAEFSPEIVFHLAAQPLVRYSYAQPWETYHTNVMGTLRILMTASQFDCVKALVNVTTDKCYENIERDYAYCEADPLGGHDMYSSSKACSEILTSSYRRSFLTQGKGFALASARAGNVIGGGDWSLDRLIPDCVHAAVKGIPVEIRNPVATRPWQHVLEPLGGYLLLGKLISKDPQTYAGPYNFGPLPEGVLRVQDVAREFTQAFGRGEIQVGARSELHEAGLLKLCIEKARTHLNWHPLCTAHEAIAHTAQWYRCFYDGQNMLAFTRKQISDYQQKYLKVFK